MTFALSAVLAVGGSLALADSAQAASHSNRSATRLLASDNMHRYVSVGLGRASRGGRYAVSSTRGARVEHHHAVLGPVRAGHEVSAWLPRVHVYNTRAATSFRLAANRGLGGGEYFEIGLRRVAPHTAYLAKVHLVPGRGVYVGLSRERNGHERLLGAERRVLPASAVHGWLNVQAQALGNAPVELAMRVWRNGHSKPARDQLTYSDRSGSRIVRTGSVAFQSYLSRTASTSSIVEFRHVRIWREHLLAVRTTHAGGHRKSPVTTPPTTTPPTTPPTTTPPTTTSPITVTGSAADAGSAALGQTSYPIPSGAVFVSPTGDDSAAGTVSSPLRTLAKAISVAPSGGTVVLRAGSYHESVSDYSKPLTVQNYPGEVVWMDGSTDVTGWTQQGSTWVHAGWTAQFNNVPSDSGTVSSAAGWSFVNSAHPMASWPDQVWRNGTALNQVASAAQVGSNDFYVDYDKDQLVVGSDPSSLEVRASDLGTALTTYASNFTFRGIGVRNYATSLNSFGALRLLGQDDTASNDILTGNATTGLFMNNSGATMDHLTAAGNGLLGLRAYHANGILVNNVLSQGNNTQGFNMSPVSGGMKIDSSRGVTVTGSQFINNSGPGAWFDSSTYGATIVGNIMANNAGHGLSYEISSTALIADNVVENNGGDGLKINDADHVQVWNNTLLNNGRDIELVEDLRRGSNLSDPGHNSQVKQPDATEPWTITDDTIMNNVFSPASNSYQLYVNDYSKQFTADQINLTLNGNQFLAGTSSPMIVWGQGSANPKLFTSAAAFVAATGQGSDNLDVSSMSSQLSDTGNDTAVALPADVATAIGQQAGMRHTGAF